MKLSEYIINYRKRMGISQRKLAERCGLSAAYISILERETNPSTGVSAVPSIETISKLANGMGISMQRLMEDVDDCEVGLTPQAIVYRQNEDFLQHMSDDERTMFRLAKTAKPEGIKAAVEILRVMQETNPDY